MFLLTNKNDDTSFRQETLEQKRVLLTKPVATLLYHLISIMHYMYLAMKYIQRVRKPVSKQHQPTYPSQFPITNLHSDK